jgi:hypothetical protein
MHWFQKDNPRPIKLRSTIGLVGKNKHKRIKMLCTYTVTNAPGDPDWMQTASDFVMKNGHKVNIPEVSVVGCNITMGDPNLFRATPVEAPKCEIKNFVCLEGGAKKDDAADVIVTFNIYCVFSTDLWNWLGQQGGEEFEMTFDAPPVPGDTVVASPESEELQLEPDDEEEEEDEEEDGDDEDPDSEDDEDGPRELTAAEQRLYEKSKSQSDIAKARRSEAGIL